MERKSQIWSFRAAFHSLRWFLIDSINVLSSLYSCIRTQGAVDNKSHYLCSPQAGIPAAWEDASGSRRPRGFQPPCCLAHNRRDHQTRRDRNHPSLCLRSPNQCIGSLIGDFIVDFKQKTIFNFFFVFCWREFLSTWLGIETGNWRPQAHLQSTSTKWGQEIQLTDVREPQKSSSCKGYRTAVTLIIWPGTKGSSSAAVS